MPAWSERTVPGRCAALRGALPTLGIADLVAAEGDTAGRVDHANIGRLLIRETVGALGRTDRAERRRAMARGSSAQPDGEREDRGRDRAGREADCRPAPRTPGRDRDPERQLLERRAAKRLRLPG